MNLIGLTGYAGSGKTTAAKHLVEAHGFVQVKFAGPLKAMMRCLGLGDREIEGDLKEVPSAILGGRTPRYAMQTIGTEWGRNLIHSNLWVNAAMAMVDDVLDHGGRVVIDDVRFYNEVEAIRARGGRIIEVYRPGLEPTSYHSSEHEQLGIADAHLLNDDTPEELHHQIAICLDLLAGGWTNENSYSRRPEKGKCE